MLRCTLVCLILSAATIGHADEAATLTLERIYGSDDFSTRTVNPKWLPTAATESASYTVLESVDGAGKSIVSYQADSGKRKVLVGAAELIPPGRAKPLSVDGYSWSADLGRVLIFTNSVRVWRRNTRGDYWVLHRGTGRLTQLGGDADAQSLMYAKFSPAGDSVAYVRDGNLFVEDLIDHTILQVTRRPNQRILNGMSDWVYEEEFGLRDGFQWSPDGKRIAYFRFDTSGVGDFTMINNTDTLYPTLKTFAYAKAGTRNSAVQVQIVELKSGETTTVVLPGDTRDNYVPRLQWLDSSGQLLVRQMNRLQNRETLYLVDVESQSKRVLMRETDDAWIDLQDSIVFTDNDESFFYLSDRDGWRHLYRYEGDGNGSTLVTKGDFDIVEFLGHYPPEEYTAGNTFFIASPHSASERFLYRHSAKEDQIVRVTPDNSSGVHAYDISPDGAYAIHRFSTTESPTQVEVVRLPDHTVVRTLETNEKVAMAFGKLKLSPARFFQIGIGDVALDAYRIDPPDMDATKRYPVLIHVYGEPAGSTVMNRWGGTRGLWHRMMAQKGYIVVSIDNRGTDVPRGRTFRKSVYRQVGTLGPNDQAAAIKQMLVENPQMDTERIGVWGWSGGGTSTLHGVFRFPDLYRTGVSVAPVANLNYYDTIYEERYMGLPTANVEGYRDGSPIRFADQLKADLLIIHGTADDNVHYQATELLINELVKHDKAFEMYVYPGRSHSISEGAGTRKHLMTAITRFLKRTLPAGPM